MLSHSLRSVSAAVAVTTLVALATPAAAQVPAAPTLQVSVSGQTVTAVWTTVSGATSYRLEVGVTPTVMAFGQDLGPLTTFSLPNVPQGTYYLRALARNASGLSAPSNVVPVVVQTGVQPPAAPSNLTATVNGTSVTLNAQLPSGLTGLLLQGGVTPGATQAVLPLSVSAQNTLPNVPPGVYYVRLVALNAGGPSAPSNEVQVVVNAPACTAPAAPTLTAQVAGQAVQLSWTAVANAAGYRLDASMVSGGSPMFSQPLPASVTTVGNPSVAPGTYYVKVTGTNACGLSATSAEVAVTVQASSGGGGGRTPNPPAGQRLPLPNRSAVVDEVARAYPSDLRNSCVSAGGNNTWLYRLVQRLRQEDTRWGLNWKRGRVGDMSQDVITYNWGSQADEGTREIYVLDIIGGHCGNNPSPAWIDVTGVGGADAIWTLQPYTAAGFPR